MSLLMALRQANWMSRERIVAYPIIFLFVYVFIAGLWLSGSSLLPEHKGVHFAHDFVNVYVAGEAVHEGHPADVYDWDKQKEREDVFERSGKGPKPWVGLVPWLYPPMFLAVAWLASFLPYYTALAAYFLAQIIAYGAVLGKVANDKKAVWALAAFPGLYINLIFGNNGCATTAFLGAGLFLLDASPVFAGIFFGILSYKPQFFILIPLALAVGRYWKALAATLASAAICAGLSLVAFGLDSWR